MKRKLSKAVSTLCKALRNDPDYFRGWKANIAMAFKDEYHRYPKKYKNQEDLHTIANKAAENFLKLLIRK